MFPGMDDRQCSSAAYPTVATIIGCPEELAGADGLVATPLVLEEPPVPQIHQTTSVQISVEEILADDSSHIKDPIQKAVIDNILGNVPTKTPQEKLKCDICNVEVTAKATFLTHLNGARHAKKVKEENLLKESESPYIEFIPNKKLYMCTLCNTTLNAKVQISMHLTGSKHRGKLKGESVSEEKNHSNGNTSKPKVDPTLNLRFCATCGITVNSDIQLQQHISSKKHVNRVNGSVTTPVPQYLSSKIARNRNIANRSTPYQSKFVTKTDPPSTKLKAITRFQFKQFVPASKPQASQQLFLRRGGEDNLSNSENSSNYSNTCEQHACRYYNREAPAGCYSEQYDQMYGTGYTSTGFTHQLFY